ncbi:DUF3325 domain-containing protein [Colwellia psychrerythraea]|uniref:DUF3325 domain-containing protein n=1 Tax=Colwellia psychrerythraea TaxID=28229 RepID=A0A099L3H4_COLPS|nr:DUF3325 domain-containing protein [Colwellia psychrerythraea]KGJ97416.1 Protein of unknown function DUF3325 [Colwellia psychrerythraea]
MLVLTSLSFSIMVLFCLAMTKHREQVLESEVSMLAVRFFRPFAWLLLLFTGYLSVDMYGWSIGPALLFGALTIATLLLILLLTYRAKIVPELAIVLSLIASMSIFIA